MKRINNLLTIGAFSILILALPAIASAQYGQYDPYGRNGQNDPYGNGRSGTYGNSGDTRSIVRDLKSRTRELQRHLDQDLDNSRYNGTRREDQLNGLAKDFRRAVNRLSESNNGPRDNDLQRVFDLGRQVDNHLSRTRVDYHLQEIWNGIENDLRALGNSNRYGDGNYRNNRNYPNNYPNNQRNLPSWWPF